MKLLVTLPHDRTKQGTVALVNDVGVLFQDRCLGKSDNAAARARGNRTRDPAKPWGDTPLGTWTAAVRFFTTPIPEAQEHSYGPYGWVTWNAANRIDLGLHGGDLAPAGRLRPTHGCVRTTNEFMRKLMDALRIAGIHEIEITVQEEANGTIS